MRILFLFAVFFSGPALVEGQEAVRTAPMKVESAAVKSESFWDAAFWKDRDGKDHKFGHVLTTLEYSSRDGQPLIKAKREYRMALQQGRVTVAHEFTLTTWEMGERLLKLEYVDGNLRRTLEEQPEGGYLVTSYRENSSTQDRIAKSYKPIGIAAEMKLVTSLRRVGEKFAYQYYDPTLNFIVAVQGEAKEIQKLDRNGKQDERESLRIVSRGQKIQGILPPEGTTWIDLKTGTVNGSLMEIPGIGYVTLARTTAEFATSKNGLLPDPGKLNNIHLPARIPGLHRSNEATYRFTLQQPTDPAELIVLSLRQTIIAGKDDLHFDLRVIAQRAPSGKNSTKEIAPEFLAANGYISSNDPKVIELAKRAVAGAPTNSWAKAQAIERWLKDHFRDQQGKKLETASEIANDRNGLCGNCRHTGILLAAMCRAEGVPSRTALGLIYAESQGEAFFAFHMWTEVNIDGEWLGLDATLGNGSIGPGHIKVTDASWAGERGMTPLLPVMNFLAKRPKIELAK